MTQPEALRLADALEAEDWDWNEVPKAAAELRRLYADNEKQSKAIQRLWKERDKLRVQRAALLEALQLIAAYMHDPMSMQMTRQQFAEKARAAIAKAEGKT